MPIFRVQFRRDTTENWEKHNPILLYGEVGYEVTTTPGLILTKQGDGYLAADGKIYGTPWNDLPYCSGPPGPSPDHQWNGTILMFKKPDGEWGPGQDLVGPVPAHRWIGTALQFQTQTGSWGDLVDLQGTPGNANLLPATTTRLGGVIIGSGLTVNEQGCINVDASIGGNLQANSEIWITWSGTWTVPVTGWYEIMAIGGGAGGFYNPASGAISGASAEIYTRLIHLNAGSTATINIGAGATNIIQTTAAPDTNLASLGGKTSFQIGNVIVQAAGGGINYVPTLGYIDHNYAQPLNSYFIYFPGEFGGLAGRNTVVTRMSGFGAGGSIHNGTSGVNPAQGVVRLRYYDPAKNNGTASDSSHTISRKAARTVNLYDPETGQGSVWREEDAPAKLAEGLITQEAWEAICAQKAAAACTVWLSDSDTEAERFEMLRAACERKLSQTDKLTLPDYPITDEQRQAILTYRQAVRDLNHQEGAPWDGGGELTPWPKEPSFLSSLPNGQKSTNS